MTRLEALERGEVYYSTGKPCRRGHNSDRFASNGSCRECLRIQQAASLNNAKVARGRRNLALASGMREFKYLHQLVHQETLQQLCDILQYSPVTLINALKDQINTIHETCPNPRVLSRTNLLGFMEYEGGIVKNLAYLNISHPEDRMDGDGRVFILHNQVRYDASEVMEVLRGQRLNVRPK